MAIDSLQGNFYRSTLIFPAPESVSVTKKTVHTRPVLIQLISSIIHTSHRCPADCATRATAARARKAGPFRGTTPVHAEVHAHPVAAWAPPPACASADARTAGGARSADAGGAAWRPGPGVGGPEAGAGSSASGNQNKCSCWEMRGFTVTHVAFSSLEVVHVV